MIPSLLNEHCQTYSSWLAARRSQARTHVVNSANNCAALTLINPLRARSDLTRYRIDSAKTPLHLSCRHILSVTGMSKSP
jgi:hypothetical protein